MCNCYLYLLYRYITVTNNSPLNFLNISSYRSYSCSILSRSYVVNVCGGPGSVHRHMAILTHGQTQTQHGFMYHESTITARHQASREREVRTVRCRRRGQQTRVRVERPEMTAGAGAPPPPHPRPAGTNPHTPDLPPRHPSTENPFQEVSVHTLTIN